MTSSVLSDFSVTLDWLTDLRHLEARAASDLADWLVFSEVEGKADRTLYARLRAIARLINDNPELAFDEFRDSHIERHLLTIPSKSRHINRSLISKWFEWGKLKRRLVENPMDLVAQVKAPHHRPPDIYTPVETAALENLPSPDGQLYALLFGSGMRRAIARRARLDHFDSERQRLIMVDDKGGKDRIVPLLTSAVVALQDLAFIERLNPGDHLWYSKPGGGHKIDRSRPIGNSTFSNWHKKCVARAGIRHLKPHTTRHTYGHILRELGYDLEERQLLMGHDDPRTTQKWYPAVSLESIATKMRALGH